MKKKIKKPVNNQKLRRGFKRCQNCQTEMHIHKKVCENCSHSNTYAYQLKSKVNMKSVDIAQKIIDYSKKQTKDKQGKKVPKRYLDSIYVIKKSLLNHNQSNIDTKLLESINQVKLKVELHIRPCEFVIPKSTYTLNNTPCNNYEFRNINDTSIVYFGCPIMSVSIKQQTILVALQYNTYDNQPYSQLHKPKISYPGVGVIAVINNQIITHIKHDYGCILQVKWHPLQNLIGTINAIGNFTIFPPSLSNYNRYANIHTIVSIKQQLLCCFDWCRSSENIVGIGDQTGNLYIVSYNNSSYQIINFIERLHYGSIKDMHFYLHNDLQMPLLVTGGYDGNVKVINPAHSTPVFDSNISSKGILQVKWDCGGKYIMVLKDELYHRAQLISFFSVLREKDSSQILQDVEQRFIQSLSGDDFTIGLASNYLNNTIYFSSSLGTVYSAQAEQVRKQAIKKEKKQTYSAKQFHKGQVDVDSNGNIMYTSEYNYEKSISKLNIKDWTHGYYIIEVGESGLVAMANILGILVIKQQEQEQEQE